MCGKSLSLTKDESLTVIYAVGMSLGNVSYLFLPACTFASVLLAVVLVIVVVVVEHELLYMAPQLLILPDEFLKNEILIIKIMTLLYIAPFVLLKFFFYQKKNLHLPYLYSLITDPTRRPTHLVLHP